jgi:hypothetical protein
MVDGLYDEESLGEFGLPGAASGGNYAEPSVRVPQFRLLLDVL